MRNGRSQPPAAPARVAVLGAGGIIAPAIVRDLAASSEVTDLLLLDLDAARAQATADAHGEGRARVGEVDPNAPLANALDGVNVLVNSASYRVNLDAMRACLEVGAHYIDLGGLYHLTGDQLALSPDFERAGLLALLGMGSSPGKTNVMAVQAVRELGATPERIEVLAAGRDLEPPDGPSWPYAPRTLVDELTMSPVATRAGEQTELEPMQDGGAYDFPEPIGRGDTIFTIHSEVRTFAESFGCRECSFRLSLAPPVLERVRNLVGTSDDEIERAARAAVPASSHTVSAHVVEAHAAQRVVRATAVTRPIEAWGIGGGIVSTATPASAAARLLARGEIEATGALPPERCVDPAALFAELEQRNCQFTLTTEETAIR